LRRAAARIRDPVRADSPLYAPRSRRRRGTRPALLTLGFAGGLLTLVAVLVGLAFAGSRHELASGTHVAGVDVGGLTPGEAVSKLERRFEAVSADPVDFVVAGASFHFAANQLGVEPNWRAAVNAAADEGDGFGPVRGFRRLHTRVFGAEVFPPVAVSNDALEFALDEIAQAVDQAPQNAALVRHGWRIETIPDRTGAKLERSDAAQAIVHALGSIDRNQRTTVVLPVVIAEPSVTAARLANVARRARIAISAAVFLRGASRSWKLPRSRIARLLELPRDGASRLAIAGLAADAYFRALGHRVDKPPVDADFDVSGTAVRVIPAQDGVELDVPATARKLLRAALSPIRTAVLVLSRTASERSTAEAEAMGITQELSTYKTYNAGTADRITNLRLGVEALDGTLVPPGETFSLNRAIGERTAERGFRPAPVIIGTKYAEEIGGGTSQVATTAFNAAWEAGVRITERNPHALYISRYPLGRDATVYWPSLDLKFLNDTKEWILVKGFPESDGIRISLYGGERRRVESSPGTMRITGRVPVKRIKDRRLAKGKKVVEEEGVPPSSTSVTRTIYGEDGGLIRTETWNTSYKAEARIVRVGTKTKQQKQGTPVPAEKTPTPGGGVTTTPTQP
jgi:vancomycin resistance protein YoaR